MEQKGHFFDEIPLEGSQKYTIGLFVIFILDTYIQILVSPILFIISSIKLLLKIIYTIYV